MRDAIEWDLATYRGQRLSDIYQGRVTLREYCVFAKGLPRESHLVKALRPYQKQTDVEDMPADAWDFTDHLLATIADKLEILYFIQLDPATRPAEPSFIPRPGLQRKKRGAAAWFGGMGIATEE